MVNYNNGLIYTIRTGDSIYVGSTCNFNRRKQQHKGYIYNENSKKYGGKLYKTIRDNDGEWDMKPHKEFSCENKTQLTIEEERVRVEMNADLNMQSCHGIDKNKAKETEKQWLLNNPDKKKRIDKKHYEKNIDSILEKKKEKTICECGCEVRLDVLQRHKRSSKHIKLMEAKMGNL
jgi:hypothetical protein